MVTLDEMRNKVPAFFSQGNRRFFSDSGYTVHRGYLIVNSKRPTWNGPKVPYKSIYRFTGNDLMHVGGEDHMTLRQARKYIDGLISRIEANSVAEIKRTCPEWFEDFPGEYFMVKRYLVRVAGGDMELWFFSGERLYHRLNVVNVAQAEAAIAAWGEHPHDR